MTSKPNPLAVPAAVCRTVLLCALVLTGCSASEKRESPSVPAPSPPTQERPDATTTPSSGAAGEAPDEGSPEGARSGGASENRAGGPSEAAGTEAPSDDPERRTAGERADGPPPGDGAPAGDGHEAERRDAEGESRAATGSPDTPGSDGANGPSASSAASNSPGASGDDQTGAGSAGGAPSASASDTDAGAGRGTRSVSELEEEFRKSLGSFDQEIREEREAVAQAGNEAAARRARQRADGQPGGAGGSPAGRSRGGDSSPNGDSSGGGMGGSAGTNQGQMPGTRHPAPPDLGNGDGDDIVARQLREAAETEPDPVLREKLWKEYREYKESL